MYRKKFLIQSDDYDVVVIDWEKGAKTKLHDHPEIGCHMICIKGCLKEISQEGERLLCVNDVGFRKGKEKHIIEAMEDSVSIHVYRNGNYTPNYFE